MDPERKQMFNSDLQIKTLENLQLTEDNIVISRQHAQHDLSLK